MRKQRCQSSSENVHWSHLCVGWCLSFANCPLSLWSHSVFCLTVNILHAINFFHYIWDFLQYKIAISNCTLICHLQNNPHLLHFVACTYSQPVSLICIMHVIASWYNIYYLYVIMVCFKILISHFKLFFFWIILLLSYFVCIGSYIHIVLFCTNNHIKHWS